MAKKNETVDDKSKAAAETMLTIEEWDEIHHTPAWVAAGLKAAYGWGMGKKLTRRQYTEAKEKWLSGPMRRRVK